MGPARISIALVSVVLAVCACRSSEVAGDADGGADGSPADATTEGKIPPPVDAGEDAACPSLPDADVDPFDPSVHVLSDVATPSWCARVVTSAYRWLCEGLVVVERNGVDCSEIWLFDAASGGLRAMAGQCNSPAPGCWAVVPGFRFPAECLAVGAGFETLCADAAADAGDAD